MLSSGDTGFSHGLINDFSEYFCMIKYTSICFVCCTKKCVQDSIFLGLLSSSKYIFLIFKKYFAPPVPEAPLTWLRVNYFSESSLSLHVEESMAAALPGEINKTEHHNSQFSNTLNRRLCCSIWSTNKACAQPILLFIFFNLTAVT